LAFAREEPFNNALLSIDDTASQGRLIPRNKTDKKYAMHYLGICAILKDEDRFIQEWMAYYTALGVEAFYLYDNGSKTPLRETLRNYESRHTRETLRIHEAPGEKIQMITYGHCITAYANACRWIAFMDIDEFVVPKQHDSLPALMEGFEETSGLAINWRVFGTSGHVVRPEGLQIENYTMATAEDDYMNAHVKCIMNPRAGNFFPTPHICWLKDGEPPIITETGNPIDRSLSSPPSWDLAQINHYYYRSKKDFYTKLRKPRADNNEMRHVYGKTPYMPEGEVRDECAVRFAPDVKKIMHEVGAL